jgi:DNA topoisomerase-6 subunit B
MSQTTLGEEPVAEESIAEELAAGQRSISIAEFFEKNKHMLGFDSGARGLVTAVKEGVDNALDACEEADILPDIYIEIEEVGDYYRLVIEDNGPGITREQVPKVFGKLLYGSRFHQREQNRGQQGIGISAAVLYSQLTSGKPATIVSRPNGGDARQFELTIDTETNEPDVDADETATWDRPHGTRVELEMEANMRARQRLHDYVQHTAVVNPHARIELREPGLDEPLKFERATEDLPDETESIRPHPHGVELGTLITLLEETDSYSISGFLQGEFARVGGKTASGIVDAFRDRHVGRELSWEPPATKTPVARSVRDAVANKPKDATEEFAQGVADAMTDADRLSHATVAGIVDEQADAVEDAHGTTFGATVRENAVEAAWEHVPEDPAADLTALVEAATSERKDAAVVEGLGERLATLVTEDVEDPRQRLDRGALRGLVDRAADLTADATDATIGETARENVTGTVWDAMETVPDDPPSVGDVAADRDAAAALLAAMRAADVMAPPTDCLAPIGSDLVEAGLRKEFDADFYAAATRDADVHGGDPFVVEAGIAYGGELADEGTIDLLRFANRVPLVYQRGACATTDVAKDIGWRNYGLSQSGGGLPEGPAVLSIHVASTNVPFTSESKDAIANVPEIEDEIELAIREAARDLKSYLNEKRSLEKRRRKREAVAEILPRMAEKLADVTDQNPPAYADALARIMNNVLVERQVDGDQVTLTVENNDDTSADLDLTEIVSAPVEVNGDGSAVEMDDEWFVSWSPSVPGGETATLTYGIDGEDASFDLQVEGIPDEKLVVGGDDA